VERETFPGLLAAGSLVMGHIDSSYWLDLGTPQAFVKGSCDLVLGAVESSALPGQPGPMIALEGAEIAPNAVVDGGSTIGRSARVESLAVVSGSVVFDDAVIGAGAVVRGSVIGRGATIGPGTVVESAVIGDHAQIGDGNELLAGLRIFPGVTLPARSVRFSSDQTS
jgi:mannose-1-phosphate guanylyltransferase